MASFIGVEAVAETHGDDWYANNDGWADELPDLNDGIGGGEFYEKYRARVESPKTQRTMRNYMAKLEQSGYFGVRETKGQRYHAVT